MEVGSGEGHGTRLQYSCLENPRDGGAWYIAVHGVAKNRTWLSDFSLTFHFHALEKEMATHSSVLAWRIPGTGEPGGLPSMRSHRVWHYWSDLAAAAAAAGGGFSATRPRNLLQTTTSRWRQTATGTEKNSELDSVRGPVTRCPFASHSPYSPFLLPSFYFLFVFLLLYCFYYTIPPLSSIDLKVFLCFRWFYWL